MCCIVGKSETPALGFIVSEEELCHLQLPLWSFILNICVPVGLLLALAESLETSNICHVQICILKEMLRWPHQKKAIDW